MMTPKANKAILILSFATIQIYLTLSDHEINFPLKAPIVTVAEVGVNSVNLSFSTEDGEGLTCYILSYQYLDSRKTPNQEWIPENYKTIHLRLHSGFQANVSIASCDEENQIQRSNWTQFTYKAPEVYICNASCYIYNVTSLNCTWDLKRDTPKEIQYAFSLRKKSKFLPCHHYLRNKQNKNIGCHMKNIFADLDRTNMRSKMWIQFLYHDIKLSKSFNFNKIAEDCCTSHITCWTTPSAALTTYIWKKQMRVWSHSVSWCHPIEILNPPVNISLKSENKIITIQWDQPPSVQKNLGGHCFEYQINLLEMKNNLLFRVFNTTVSEYSFLDLDKDKKYSAQIRGRKIHCSKSKFWGEWSEPIFIGKDNENNTTWHLLVIIVICATLLSVAILYLIKRNRKIFDTAIPVPSKKLNYWISSSEINFQKSVLVLPNESVPITDIEIISVTDCLESQIITM